MSNGTLTELFFEAVDRFADTRPAALRAISMAKSSSTPT